MSDVPLGLVFAMLGGAVMLLGLVVGLFWWVGRPAAKPAQTRQEEPLPLFGHAHAAIWGRDDDETPDGAAISDVLSARVERANAGGRVPSWRAPNSSSAAPAPTAPDIRRPAAAPATPAAAESSTEHASPATRRRPSFDPASYAPPSVSGSTAAAAPDATPAQASASHATRAARTPATASASARTAASAATPAIMAATTVGPPSPRVEGRTVRVSVPTDATLQFLPGRLEIIRGEDAGREIRFVRTGSVEGAEITFGRNEGAPFRHVQLHDATVSRLHAVLRLAQGRWMLTNRSTTNPVVHNGRTMGDGEAQALGPGDTVEMGQVVFRFRD